VCSDGDEAVPGRWGRLATQPSFARDGRCAAGWPWGPRSIRWGWRRLRPGPPPVRRTRWFARESKKLETDRSAGRIRRAGQGNRAVVKRGGGPRKELARTKWRGRNRRLMPA